MSETSISDAEWRVMTVLWDDGVPLTARQVIDALDDSTDWQPKTVKTLLSRLVKKGALAYEVEGNRYRYEPRVSREEAVRQESRSFLERVFAGDEASALLHFARRTRLSDAQIDRLRGMLDSADAARSQGDEGDDR